jgi:hypothetical protein
LFSFERDYNWKGLVAAFGPKGQLWVDTYLHEVGGIRTLLRGSAAALREGSSNQSLALLEEARDRRNELESSHPSIFHLVGRFYFGSLAFHFFAAVALDIPMKRARIARARSDWGAVRAHAAALQEGASDREPLFVLFGREPIYHSTIAERFADTILDASLLPALSYLKDRKLREKIVGRAVGQLQTLPEVT